MEYKGTAATSNKFLFEGTVQYKTSRNYLFGDILSVRYPIASTIVTPSAVLYSDIFLAVLSLVDPSGETKEKGSMILKIVSANIVNSYMLETYPPKND